MLIISFAVLGLSEILFGFIVPRLVIHSGDTYINRWHDFYTKGSNAQIVILGSSRVHRHCDPEIISSGTHLKTEVVATAGANYFFYEKLFEDYLKRNERPRLLIVGIDLTGLGTDIFVPYPEYFFPFLQPTDAIASFDEYHFIKYHKALGYFYYKDIYYDKIQNPWTVPHQSGFLPEEETQDLNPLHRNLLEGYQLKVSDRTLKSLFEFINEQKKAGTTCIGIISPEYFPIWSREVNRDQALRKIFREAGLEKFKVINFSDGSYKLCFNKNYFFNDEHLNRAGAEIFSKDLADSINRYYP
jgi:hypothetical protein